MQNLFEGMQYTPFCPNVSDCRFILDIVISLQEEEGTPQPVVITSDQLLMYNIPVQAYINFELNASFSLCASYDVTVEIAARNLTKIGIGVTIGFSFLDFNFADYYKCMFLKGSLFKEVGISAVATPSTSIEKLHLSGNSFIGGCDKTAFNFQSQSSKAYRIPSIMFMKFVKLLSSIFLGILCEYFRKKNR